MKDTNNFDSEFTSEKPIVTPVDESPLTETQQELFAGFSYQVQTFF